MYLKRFDLRTGDWLRVAPMLEGRYCAKAVVLDERIYVMGGSENECALNSVECYEPMLDTWEARACMIEARASPGVSDLQLIDSALIYIVKTYRPPSLMATFMFWVVTMIHHWTQSSDLILLKMSGLKFVLAELLQHYKLFTLLLKVCSLTTARSRISAVVFNYHLLALGGTKNGEGVNSVEEYNVDADKWVLKAPMPNGAAYSSFVVPTHFADQLQTFLADVSQPAH